MQELIHTLPARIREKILVTARGCWIWTGARNGTCGPWEGGYAYVWWEGASRRAHRVIYELLREPIPPGTVLDHACENRDCVNPWCLEPVTSGENNRRTWARGAR